MTSRYCTQCGASVRDDDLFCGKCGTRLTAPAPVIEANRFDPWAQSTPPTPAPSEPRYLPESESSAPQMVLIAVGIALMIGIGAAVFVLSAAGS